MDAERVVVAQLIRLLRGRPGVVWELVDAARSPRPGDVPLRDQAGTVVAYARPVPSDAVTECAAAHYMQEPKAHSGAAG